MSGDARQPDPGDDPLRERLVSSEVLRRSRILEFRVDTIESTDGHRSTRDIAGHPGGVCVVAIDPDDRVLLVRQWRHAAGRALLEIPAGTLDREPDGSIEGHAGAAARELEEETGSRAGRPISLNSTPTVIWLEKSAMKSKVARSQVRSSAASAISMVGSIRC